MRVLICLLWLAAFGSHAPATPANAPHGPWPGLGDPTTARLDQLHRWVSYGPVVDPELLQKGEKLLTILDQTWVLGAERSDEIHLGLLDFLGRCLRIEDEVARTRRPVVAFGALVKESEEDLRRRATEILRRRLPESRRFLALKVLMGRVDGENHPLDRRLAVCEILKEDQGPEATLALLTLTHSSSPQDLPLVNAAIDSLAGREDAGVHLRLIELLGRAEEGKVTLWKGGIELHFRQVEIPMEENRSIEAVRAYVLDALASEDWRRASRGVSIARCLPHSKIVPDLIEALGIWVQRGQDAGRAVRRVQGEILAELHHRSGRSLGAVPERWESLWQGYLRGDIQLRGEGPMSAHVTVGGFFGLRPETDRVTFVLDRSGSMEAGFGSEKGHSRLEEAADQMASLLLQMGVETRFNVVLFSDGARSWRSELQSAEESSIKSARTWVRTSGPKGGTHLKEGVLEAMGVDGKGQIDLDALQTDTIIVLCDGETAEGPTWVEPFLRSANDDARVVFYAVQIGGRSDGTLESLCRITGGEFLHVDD